MDEFETVNRRDAITGLGVLGGLMLALFAAIFFRIVNPRPAEQISVHDLALAPEISTETPFAYQLPGPIENARSRQDDSVSSASFTESPAAPSTRATTQPTFVAPGER